MLEDKPPRVRRRDAPGSDSVKHRRTRSGCYTCRARRVKCDESRPTCERCQKGSRECTYPDRPIVGRPSASGKTPNIDKGTFLAGLDTSEDDEDEEFDTERNDYSPISGTVDQNDHRSSTATGVNIEKAFEHSTTYASDQNRQVNPSLDASQPPSLGASQRRRPSTEDSPGATASQQSSLHSLSHVKQGRVSSGAGAGQKTRSKWTKFPPTIQFYLKYHQTHLTRHHYSLKHDSHDFIQTTLLDIAVENEALLYSVVGFAAYHHTLTRQDGQIRDFLQYYNKSVNLLMAILAKNKKHDMAVLLTILQLATFEEFMGEWVNLLGHQKAAFQILTKLFTYETIMETELQRAILGWYTRFDVIAGLLSGSEMVLGREWFNACHQHYLRGTKLEPDNLKNKIDEKQSAIRLLAFDLAHLIAKRTKGTTTLEEFMLEDAVLSQRIASWYTDMDPRLRDQSYTVHLEGKLEPSDVVNPFEPGLLLSGPLWSMNFVMCDWYGVDLMHRYQTALALQQAAASNELEAISKKSCQIIEAMQRYSENPSGILIALQASVAISSLFFPKDLNHNMWIRHKFAEVERQGYIYPPNLRGKLALLWGDPSVNQWWLPNDADYPQIIRDIRAFVEDRTTQPKDSSSSDLREMRALFSNVNLDSNSSPGSDQRSPSQRQASDESSLSRTASFSFTPAVPTPQLESSSDPFPFPQLSDDWTFEEEPAYP